MRKSSNTKTSGHIDHTEISPKASAKSGRIWRVLRNVLFVVLLAIFVLQIIVTALLGRNPELLVTKMPVRLLEITSDSMYPTVKTGDGVLETATAYAKLQTGDIITFYQGGDLITHEVIAVNEDGSLTTQGEANGIPDQPVTEADYVGKVHLILPGLSNFLSMSYGMERKAIWIALFLVILFGPEVIAKCYDQIAQRIAK